MWKCYCLQYTTALCMHGYLIEQLWYIYTVFIILNQSMSACVKKFCSCLLETTSVARTTLSTFRALSKFNLNDPHKLFIQKLLLIIGQFTIIINTLLGMHACTMLIFIIVCCKMHSKLLLLCAYCCFCRLFHLISYNNETAFVIITCTHVTQPS